MASKTLVCSGCQGEMTRYVGPKHNRILGVFLICGGVLSSLYWVGVVLGIPLFAIGAYLTAARRKLWVCQDCNTAIERIDVQKT